MPGPCSLPAQDKRRYEELNEIVCNIHFNCDMREYDKHGKPVAHEYITYRQWLFNRNKLRTGKTL